MTPVRLCPMPDYSAVRRASLRRYRERIADILAFQTTRTAMLAHGVVDQVAREIDPRSPVST